MGGGVVAICEGMHVVRWCRDMCIYVMGTWDGMICIYGKVGGGGLLVCMWGAGGMR